LFEREKQKSFYPHHSRQQSRKQEGTAEETTRLESSSFNQEEPNERLKLDVGDDE